MFGKSNTDFSDDLAKSPAHSLFWIGCARELAMSEEKETVPSDVPVESKPTDDPGVDLAKQNEQTVAQTNAINDAVKATQVFFYLLDPLATTTLYSRIRLTGKVGPVQRRC